MGNAIAELATGAGEAAPTVSTLRGPKREPTTRSATFIPTPIPNPCFIVWPKLGAAGAVGMGATVLIGRLATDTRLWAIERTGERLDERLRGI
jgi:hypothetical protein